MVRNRIDALEDFRKQLEGADVDLLREMVKVFAEQLMGAEADALCGADYGERSPERVNRRNGYRERAWDTRAGTIALAGPEAPRRHLLPDWLLEPRRRAERAFVQVVAECYVRGVSTRRVEGLVRHLGIERISKSQVSEMAKSSTPRSRRSGPGRWTAVPTPTSGSTRSPRRCAKAGRIVNVACVVATGVNAQGNREILGTELFTTEDGAGWTAFLRGLVARGLSGVRLVISDAHPGLVDAIASTLPGASWQRCRTHFMRNLLRQGPEVRRPVRRHAGALDLRPARRRRGRHATGSSNSSRNGSPTRP